MEGWLKNLFDRGGHFENAQHIMTKLKEIKEEAKWYKAKMRVDNYYEVMQDAAQIIKDDALMEKGLEESYKLSRIIVYITAEAEANIVPLRDKVRNLIEAQYSEYATVSQEEWSNPRGGFVTFDDNNNVVKSVTMAIDVRDNF